MHSNRLLTVALVSAASLATGACATLQSADRRASSLDAQFREYAFQRSCDALWPSALKVAASRGFPLSGKDRQILGEAPDGVMTQLVSAATQTYRTESGGLLTATDWNRESGTRLRITATPAGADACRVRYDVIGGGVATADEQDLGPDWSLDLDLLQLVDPGAAAKVEAGIPASR